MADYAHIEDGRHEAKRERAQAFMTRKPTLRVLMELLEQEGSQAELRRVS